MTKKIKLPEGTVEMASLEYAEWSKVVEHFQSQIKQAEYTLGFLPTSIEITKDLLRFAKKKRKEAR